MLAHYSSPGITFQNSTKIYIFLLQVLIDIMIFFKIVVDKQIHLKISCILSFIQQNFIYISELLY